MKVYFSPASPFVRKVVVCAAELGLEVERLPSNAHPVNRDRVIAADNPLGQVPTFFADDGTPLYDSRVICEHLDAKAGGSRLFPVAGAARWRALVEQSLGDGLLDAALLARYEMVVRPAEKQWPDWHASQMDKIRCALDRMQAWAPGLGDRVDIGTITLGCALGYLDFRFPDYAWRDGRAALADWYERFAARPSMAQTWPSA
jgi:glutathione S-transferase